MRRYFLAVEPVQDLRCATICSTIGAFHREEKRTIDWWTSKQENFNLRSNSNSTRKFTWNSSLFSNLLVRRNFSRTIFITLCFNCSLKAKYFPVEFNSYSNFRRLKMRRKTFCLMKKRRKIHFWSCGRIISLLKSSPQTFLNNKKRRKMWNEMKKIKSSDRYSSRMEFATFFICWW